MTPRRRNAQVHCASFVVLLLLLDQTHSSGLANVALNKDVKQVGRLIPKGTTYSPYFAVDGNTNTKINYCAHVKDVGQPQPLWWIVDLEGSYDIHSVLITNRGDCCGDRLRNFEVEVYSHNPLTVTSAQRKLCYYHPGQVALGRTISITCNNQPIRGRYVRVVKPWDTSVLQLCEVQVMASLSAPPSAVRFVLLSGTKAPYHVIFQMTSETKARCMTQCTMNRLCTAVNVARQQIGRYKRSCQLLDYGGMEGMDSSDPSNNWMTYILTV